MKLAAVEEEIWQQMNGSRVMRSGYSLHGNSVLLRGEQQVSHACSTFPAEGSINLAEMRRIDRKQRVAIALSGHVLVWNS